MCFSSRFSPVSLLFHFLCLICFFSESSSLVPVLVFSTSSSSPFLFPCRFPFCFLGFVLFLCLAPSAFLSSASLSRFPSVSSSDVFSFGSVAFRPPPGFPPLPLHLVSILFLFWFSSASRLLFSLGFCLRWFSSAHPLVCLSCSVVWPASIFLSSSSSLFLLFSCGFRFLFSFVRTCLVFLIACALVISAGGGGGGVVLCKCLSAFCPPLLCASRGFSSGFSAFSPLFVRLPLLSLFLRCLQLLHLFLWWLRPPPLASLLLSLCLLPRGSWYLRSPFLRCLDWVGGLYTWSSAQVLPQAPIGVSSLSAASPLLSVPHPAVPSSSLPAFQPQGVSGFYPLTLLSCLRLP